MIHSVLGLGKDTTHKNSFDLVRTAVNEVRRRIFYILGNICIFL